MKINFVFLKYQNASRTEMNTVTKIRPYFIVFFLAMGMFFSFPAYTQDRCNQANITVTSYELRKPDGSVFGPNDTYMVGADKVDGKIYVKLGGVTETGYNMSMMYDIYVNGQQVGSRNQVCLFRGVPITLNSLVPVADFSWTWGAKIELRNIFFTWEKGVPKDDAPCKVYTAAEEAAIKAQCYLNGNGFIAFVPLYPKFDFGANTTCKNTVQFTSTTTGGVPANYTYQWSFGSLGTVTGPNPTFVFPSAGEYPVTLTVNDGVSTNSMTKTITVAPTYQLQMDVLPTFSGQKNGSINIRTITGGNPTYRYSWTGPNGFKSSQQNISGLESGKYELIVTDSQDCVQKFEFLIESASILSIEMKDFMLRGEADKVTLIWEMNLDKDGSSYEIQRSFKDIYHFTTIGEIQKNGPSVSNVTYTFKDDKFPIFEDLIYYRIVHHYGGVSTYSPVKMYKRDATAANSGNWISYPNPTADGLVKLKYKNREISSNDRILIRAINGGTVYLNTETNLDYNGEIRLDQLFGPLPAGLTMVIIQWGNQTETIKILR